jgi:8-oxo-dGTP pyrophosphatase MutT (NUDIX family)
MLESELPRAASAVPADQLRRAAVALILYAQDGDPWLLFTRRTERVADHKGQISFPGGSQDPTDASLVETALREAQEELGVDPGSLRVVAGLEPVFTVVTRYIITPFVAYTPRRPEVRPNAFEVAEVIDVPIPALLDPAIRRVEVWDSHGVPREVYFYQYGEHNIWGATARILKQFLERCYTSEWWQGVVRGEVAYRPPTDTPPTPV